MSISSLGMLGTMAATSLAQSKGSEIERASTDTANRSREADSEHRAEAAAGVEASDEEVSANDRDADGRRMWEDTSNGKQNPTGQPSSESSSTNQEVPKSKDATGEAGRNLDLSG